MEASYHRQGISGNIWKVLSLHLPAQRGEWGGIAHDNCCLINAVFWILHTGAPWRDFPADYGSSSKVDSLAQKRSLEGVWKLDIIVRVTQC